MVTSGTTPAAGAKTQSLFLLGFVPDTILVAEIARQNAAGGHCHQLTPPYRSFAPAASQPAKTRIFRSAGRDFGTTAVGNTLRGVPSHGAGDVPGKLLLRNGTEAVPYRLMSPARDRRTLFSSLAQPPQATEMLASAVGQSCGTGQRSRPVPGRESNVDRLS